MPTVHLDPDEEPPFIAGDLEPDGPAIDVPGDLVIEGHVERPAGINAGGDVHVLGGVQGTPVRAGGRIVVHGGVRQGAHLVAGQDVYARFVEHAAIEAGRDVVVREDLIRANVSAPRARVGGSIVGGELALLEWLVAGTLGSELAVPTYVAVVPPPPPADDGRAIARARRELAEQGLRLEILLDEHRRLAKDPRNDGARAMVVKLATLILHLRERDKALADQAAAQPAPAPVARPYVRIHGELHPGVAVRLGAQHLRSATRVPGALLLEGASAVEIAPLDLEIEGGRPMPLITPGRPDG